MSPGDDSRYNSKMTKNIEIDVHIGRFACGHLTDLSDVFSVDNNSPEYVCVGGLSKDLTQNGTCGDFAGMKHLYFTLYL